MATTYPDLQIDWLRAFVTVVDSGSLTRAAPQLYRSQSAVSMQIKKLEEALGQPVLLRGPRHLEVTPVGTELLPFAPEKVWSYEGGWRWTLANGAMRLNGTLFRSDVQDLQTPSAFVRPNGTLTFITRNFAGLRNQGLELEVAATPVKGLNVYLNAGLQDAKYVDITQPILAQQASCITQIATLTNPAQRTNCAQGIVTATGSIALPVRVPKQTYNFGGSYAFALADTGMKLTPAINFTRVSRTNIGTAENAFSEAHTTSNMSVTLSGRKDVWSLTADCSNCSDKTYNTSVLGGFLYLNDPRRYTARLTFNFK
mgnify:CR=1 FL=1